MNRILLFFLFVFHFVGPEAHAQGIIGKLFGKNDTLHPQYQALQKKLRDYEKLVSKGGWCNVPTSKDSIKAGKKSATVLMLRQRLEAEGYLKKRLLFRTDSFDQELTAALKHYQKNNGLPETGYLNKVTIAALNVPAEKRVEQILLNMQRWKAMNIPDSKYILVNVPDFKMDVYEGEQTVQSMKVVVGKPDRQTPIFSSRLTYLVLNPTWNIPQNVLKKDVLPRIKKDPEYLYKSRMKVFSLDREGQRHEVPVGDIDWAQIKTDHFPYEIIQDPGKDNSLGIVKFVFPNEYSVYMHDSPAKKLFRSDFPLFSSGCVRLSNAIGLAEYLLSQQDWDRERIDSVLSSGETKTVVLESPVPVFIQYYTAWVNAQGELQFRRDIYGRDQEESESLLSAQRSQRRN